MNFEAAWGYNMRRYVTASRLIAHVESMGIDGWQSRRELLDDVATWQHARGLHPDGKVGPSTVAALDES